MKELKKIIQKTEKDLKTEFESPFTNESFDKFRNNILNYIEELYDESLKTSKRDNTEKITVNHINKANSYLIKNTKSKYTNLYNSIGGIFLGTTISSLFSLTTFNVEFNNIGIIIIVLLGIIGTFLLSIGLFKM